MSCLFWCIDAQKNPKNPVTKPKTIAYSTNGITNIIIWLKSKNEWFMFSAYVHLFIVKSIALHLFQQPFLKKIQSNLLFFNVYYHIPQLFYPYSSLTYLYPHSFFSVSSGCNLFFLIPFFWCRGKPQRGANESEASPKPQRRRLGEPRGGNSGLPWIQAVPTADSKVGASPPVVAKRTTTLFRLNKSAISVQSAEDCHLSERGLSCALARRRGFGIG